MYKIGKENGKDIATLIHAKSHENEVKRHNPEDAREIYYEVSIGYETWCTEKVVKVRMLYKDKTTCNWRHARFSPTYLCKGEYEQVYEQVMKYMDKIKSTQ